jgi:hypothetical protein
VSFPVLSQIKPQAPHHGGALPSIPLSFSLATILPPEPRLKDFSSGAERVIKNPRPIPSRHRLLLRLQRYLIVFDPLTFVLDQ